MVIRISQLLRNERGKAESKAPGMIVIFILLIAAYWGWKYGTLYYKDFMFTKDIEKNLKYDPYKIRFRPSPEKRKEVYINIARKYGIMFNDKQGKQYLKVGNFPGTKWYTVDVKYKRIVKNPLMKPQVKWFHHKLRPSNK